MPTPDLEATAKRGWGPILFVVQMVLEIIINMYKVLLFILSLFRKYSVFF